MKKVILNFRGEKHELTTEETNVSRGTYQRQHVDSFENIDNPWQPMETVPKDGTVIDLYHKNGFRVTDQWWDSSDECWVCLFDDKDFIGWMMIPPHPEYIK